MASGFRAWRNRSLNFARCNFGRGACSDSYAHGSRLDDRGTFERLCANAPPKSIPETSVLFRHAFPNALIPVITIVGLQFGSLLAGTIVTETIFSWPGIGRLAVQAISARDYPLLQGCILIIAVSYVAVNLLTDLVYAIVDPRVRLQ